MWEPGEYIAYTLLNSHREIVRDELFAKHGADFWKYEPDGLFDPLRPWSPEERALLENPAGASEAVRARFIRKYGRWPFGDPKP